MEWWHPRRSQSKASIDKFRGKVAYRRDFEGFWRGKEGPVGTNEEMSCQPIPG